MTAPAAGEFKLADVVPAPEEGEPAPGDQGQDGSVPPEGEHTETTGHEGGGHGAKPGLPQLDTTTFAGQIFWLVISFVALYLVISRIAAPKISGVLADRRARIQGDLDSAADAKKASEAAIANYERALQEAKSRALKIGEEVRNQVQTESNTKSEAAAKQLAADTQKAEARIAEMRSGALAKLNAIARDTAAEIVLKLTGEQASAGDLDAAIAAELKRT